jgi:hypothetical protein
LLLPLFLFAVQLNSINCENRNDTDLVQAFLKETRAVYIYTHYLFSTKETVQYTDSKEIKTMSSVILLLPLFLFAVQLNIIRN